MEQSTTAQGWFDTLKEYVNPSKIAEKLQMNKNQVFEYLLIAGGGFLIGFILKRYGRVGITLFFVALALIGLDYLGVIDVAVHWEKVQELFGIQPTAHINGNVMTLYTDWVKANFGAVLSFAIGLILGWKAG
jgi:hypothetical protein